MKTLLASVLALAFTLTLHANETLKADLIRADDARIEAMKKADAEALKTLLSDELNYAHSNGVVDNKASLTEILTTGKTKYVGYDYVERNFTFPAQDIALMTGRTRIQADSAKGRMDSVLSFLAVWRLEKGQWKFLAWQSCKLPAANP